MASRSLALALCLAPLLAACPPAPSGPADAGMDAGPPDAGPPPDACADFQGVDLDLSPWLPEGGEGAHAGRALASDLLRGAASRGRAGLDWALRSDALRAVVQGADRHIGPVPYGGTLVDLDVPRADTAPGGDGFGELGLLVNLGRTVKVDQVCVLKDGAGGGPAVLAVTGHDVLDDYLDVPRVLGTYLSSFGKTWLAIDTELGLTVTQYFIVVPGEPRVRIVTALRNDAGGPRTVVLGEVLDGGGEVDLFLPTKVVGDPFGGITVPEIAPDYLGWMGDDVAYAYDETGPDGASSFTALTIAGVTILLDDVTDLSVFIGNTPPTNLPAGAVRLPAGAVHTLVRDVYVGPDLAAVRAAWARDRGVGLGTISGTVVGPDGAPAPAGTRVAVLSPDEHVFTVLRTDDGAFSGEVPAGTWTLSADAPGFPFPPDQTVEVAEGGHADARLELAPGGRLFVRVRTPDGGPTPAKVTLICPNACPKSDRIGARFRDVRFDRLPPNVQTVGFVGPSGEAVFDVPPGLYDVVVSRGAEWSTDPAGWPADHRSVVVPEGGIGPLEAEIAHVVDTTGWISGDLHVHAIDSPDSTVTNTDRVRSFLAEGVDVIVATDHDFVTDYRPEIASLGAEDEIVAVAGEEVSTFDFGHFNGFPLVPDPDDLLGGALDWAGGDGPTLTPREIFAALRDGPGPAEKVVQVNHPRGFLGYFTAIGLDTGSGATATDPAVLRLPSTGGQPGDTGLFDPSFTAMEILTGYDFKTFNTRLRDWFAFLERGLTATATAVSDTHNRYILGVGNPHSWIRVGAGKDNAAGFEQAAFVAGLNGGHVVGGTGPFVQVTASADGAEAGPGEVLSVAPGTTVNLHVAVQLPTWLAIDRIELYANVDGTDARPGHESKDPPPVTRTIPVDLASEIPVPGAYVGASGTTKHKRYLVERDLEVTADRDGWYVVLVRGDASAFPEILDADVPTVGFANPVYVDTDGNGRYDPPRAFEPPAP